MAIKKMKNFMKFFFAFVSKPKATGAIAPSSDMLCKAMIDRIDWDNVNAIVEYGPGTGVVTRHILKKIEEVGKGTRYFAIELNSKLVKQLRKEFPGVQIYEDSVENVKHICEQEGIEQVDAVVSGLPWAIFPKELQDKLMDATLSILKPGGQFVTFTYIHAASLPAGKRFRFWLNTNFQSVDLSKVIWMNLPPAFVYYCQTSQLQLPPHHENQIA